MVLGSWRIDAFATSPGEGNAAEVVLLERWLPAAVLQDSATSIGAPATAYLVAVGEAFEVRWFTPTVELPLCGHASLAAAHVLLDLVRPGTSRVELLGPTCRIPAERRAGRITLELPATPAVPVPIPGALVDALGKEPAAVLDAGAYVAVYEHEDDVRRLAPDLRRIAALQRRGVAVTAPGLAYDFVSRYFAPRSGCDEDQATGSAHCALAPWWAERLGKTTLRARQVSPRGADVWCACRGPTVWLGGHVQHHPS